MSRNEALHPVTPVVIRMKEPYQPSSFSQVFRLANLALSWPNWFQLCVLLGSVERDQISSIAAQGGNCSVFRLIYMRVSVWPFQPRALGQHFTQVKQKVPFKSGYNEYKLLLSWYQYNKIPQFLPIPMLYQKHLISLNCTV